jgi:hypothetical protein
MKSLSFILIIALTIQPLQAGVCAMVNDQGEGQSQNQLEVKTSHQHSVSSGPAGAMEHAMPMSPGMNMDHSDEAMQDCCDSDSADQPTECADMNDCGSCYAGSSVLVALSTPLEQWLIQYKALPSSGEIVPSHAYPPFRPPIS